MSPLARWLFGLLLLCLLLPATGQAAARAFTERFSTNATGDIYLIGNTAETCDNVSPATLWGSCNNGRAGTGADVDNNDFLMAFVDENGNLSRDTTDPTGGPTSTTSADLSLPAGSTVLWAGLYWGGESSAASRSQVTFTLPSGASNTITSSVVDGIANVGGCQDGATRCDRYGAFADVTNLVRAAGNGTYKVRDIQSWRTFNSTDMVAGSYAGWGLVVVFSNSSLTLKNLTVFDGFDQVTNTAITIPVSGFLTPLSGPVKTTLGFIVGEGELGNNGDNMALNTATTYLYDAIHPQGNFFTSSISDLGTRVTSKAPNYVNQLGWDVGRVNASNILGNGATSTSIYFSTGQEYYFPMVATFATELYVPIVTPNVVKTGVDLNGGNLVPGDTLRYTISMSNTGLDTATNLMLADNIPLYTSYVPGSLNILTGPAGAPLGAMSDTSGNDAAEYVVGSGDPADPLNPPKVNFRLGAGANASSGGDLKYGESTSLRFDVKLDDTIPAGTILTNRAQLSYNGQTLGTVYAAASSAAASAVAVPPAVSKTFTPAVVADWTGTSTLSMVFTNPASNTAAVTGVSVTDTYPAGLINASPANPSLTCTAGSTPGSLVGGLAGGNTIGMSNTTIAQGGSCTLSVRVKSNVNGSGIYTNTLGQVTTTNAGNTTSPSAASTFSVGRPTIAKAFGAASIPSGASTTVSFTLTNPNAVDLHGVSFNDVLPAGLTFASAAASQCNGGTVALSGSPQDTLTLTGGTIAAAPGTCTVTATVTGSTGGSYDNTASGVTSTETPSAGPVSNTANLQVYAPLTATRNFIAPSISTNGSSVMTVVLSNPNPSGMGPVTGVGFTDNYPTSPGNLLNSTSPNVTTTCSAGSSAGTITAAAGGNSLAMSGGSLASGGSCTISLNVTSATAGDYSDSADAIATANAGNAAVIPVAALNVASPPAPTATKSFAMPVAPGGSSLMTITLSNATGTPVTLATLAANGIHAMTDTYPANLVNAAIPAAATTCTGGVATATAGGSTLILDGGTIPANGSCTVTVNVTSAAADLYNNNTGLIYTANAGVCLGAAGNVSFLYPPTITKSFSPNPVAPTSLNNAYMTVTIGNPAANPVALTGIGFSDTYPSGMTNYTNTGSSNTCGGTVTAADNSNSLVLGGATNDLAPGATCTVVRRLRIAAGTTPMVNTTGAVTSTNGGTGSTATATLYRGNPGIAKSFNPTTVMASTQYSTLTFTLTNPTGTDMTGAAFTDTYPTGMTNYSPLTVTENCSGSITVDPTTVAGGGFFKLNAANITANSSCNVTVRVVTSATGTNTIPVGDFTTSGGSNAVAASATLTVGTPSVSKTFDGLATSPPIFALTGTSVMRITLTNPTGVAMTGAAFTDIFPPGMKVHSTPAASNTCGGTFTANAADTSVSLGGAGGTIPANGSCYVQVTIVSSASGINAIPIGGITTTNGGSNLVAGSASLVVVMPPEIAKSFAPASISTSPSYTAGDVALGRAANLTITIANPTNDTISNLAFTDTYPSTSLKNGVAGAAATTSCTSGSSAGTVTAAATGSSLAVSNASLLGNGSCTITMPVYATSADLNGYLNHTGTITSNRGTGPEATATLTVLDPFTGSQAFAPDTVNVNDVTILTITLNNPNAIAVTGVSFTDTYVSGLVNATPAAVTSSCGGSVTAPAGTDTLSFSGGTIPASGSCTITASVISTTSGNKANPAFNAGSSNGGTSSITGATLTVVTNLAPVVTKTFTPAQVTVNTDSLLTITLTNPAANGANAITGVALTDAYPAGLINSGGVLSNTCGGAATGVDGGNTLALSNATIPGNNGTCAITINVKSATLGAYLNNTGPVTSTNAATAATDSDTLVVTLAAPTAAKGFSPAMQSINFTSLLTITLSNPNGADIAGVNFTDLYPAGLVNSVTPAAATTCGGAVTAAAGGNSLALTGGTVPAGGSCTVTVYVASPGAASYTNSTGVIYSSNAESGAAATGNVEFFGTPSLTVVKSADVGNVAPGGTITYTIQIQNAGTGEAQQVAITDNLSDFTDLFLDAYGSNDVFDFIDGGNPSGLPGTATVQFSTDGSDFTYSPTNVGGYDEQVRALRLTMDGDMAANPSAQPSFQIKYQVRVK